uniref:Reverse transcriptase zinc-binding domain-containing protein n=1 Tax=Nicotiana tabacum TaxID=4097 RepID=A0A1S4DD81_TOBAC
MYYNENKDSANNLEACPAIAESNSSCQATVNSGHASDSEYRTREKVEKRLATWQLQYLSMGGRLTLISSVMDSIPTYYMSLYPMPSKVLQLRRTFLWKGNSEGHKFHLVKWSKVIQLKDLGGLGIKDLAKHNKSMLMKWLGKFGDEDTSLWKKVNVSFKVGNGSHVRFWKDIWFGNCPLKESFPLLFQIANDPNSTVREYRSENAWAPLFRRNMHDWELDNFFVLLERLGNLTVNDQIPDKLIRGRGSADSYTVKAGYRHMCEQNGIIDSWPWKLIWRTKLPTKVICFTWTALKEASNMWNMFLAISGLSWTQPQGIKEAVEGWSRWKVDRAIKK